MAKVLSCECGLTVRGADEEELVRLAREHLEKLHPAVAAQVSDEQVVAMAEDEPDVQVS